MAYDLGVTARQRYVGPTYSAVGGTVTIVSTGSNTYYYHTFVTTGTFTNTSAIPIPIQIVNGAGTVVQSTTVPSFGTFNAVTTSSGAAYAVHTFNSSGAFTATSSLTNVSALLVAGGGGGGYGRTGNHAGGGGGAGGVRYYQNLDVASGAKTITVGGGGAAFTQGVGSSITGFPGSVVNPTGGGGGGGGGGADGFPGGIQATGGGNGGSGGGGSPGYTSVAGGTGIAGEGFNGAGIPFTSEGGSGGGAGAAGSINIGTVGAAGGIGRLINITGTSTYYGGGGGSPNTTAGLGGLGGGGTGAGASTPATAGTPNTGGGGGGATPPNIIGGSGGSGVVIISYPSALGVATGGTITSGAGPGLTIRYLAPPSNSPDPNFKNTTLLLSTDATTTFVDDVSNFNNNISIVGNTRPDNFNPYAENYSLNFNTSTNFLRVASTSTVAFGTGDFTVEAWIYVIGTNGTYRTIYSTRPSSSTEGVFTGGSFGVNPTGGLYWYTGEFTANNVSDLLLTNRWNHVAAVRQNGNVTIFLNGSVVQNSSILTVNYLVVAGGGGGGGTSSFTHYGGGGGGGGLLSGTIGVTTATYAVIIGAGGAYNATNAAGGNGSSSSWNNISTTGGGGGGAAASPAGKDGGSGGGAGNINNGSSANGGTGVSGPPRQGFNGGSNATGGSGSSAGGGGGAGGNGSNGVDNTGGNGGIGIQSTISGIATYYAGGGYGAGSTFTGTNGLGGGNTANRGGGGSGSKDGGPIGTEGGSGIVILSHPDSRPQATVTGGVTITTTGSNIVYTFTASGTISFVENRIEAEYLLVAGGGGGGGHYGGGGGAGGYLSSPINASVGITYAIVVGAGGSGGPPFSSSDRGGNGGNSSFSLLSAIAVGGGGGGTRINVNDGWVGQNGGSGGGGGNEGGTGPAGTGTAGQGNNGGIGFNSAGNSAGGGGGGAGSAGGAGANLTGGAAGAGLASSISGSSVTYATGGSGASVTVRGTSGGGANTGGGGAGGQSGGGGGDAGSSGVAIIRHSNSYPQATVTGNPIITTTGSNIVYTFTASGSITFLGTGTSLGDNLTLTTATIGANLNGSEPFSGYISNLRVVKGQGLYTEEFTVGTQPLTTSTAGHSINSAITGTVALLTAASNRFVDKSPANLAITGTAVVSNLQPFIYPYSFNGSAYFDGNDSYLRCDAALGSLTSASTPFTMEVWFYCSVAPTEYKAILGHNSSADANQLLLGLPITAKTFQVTLNGVDTSIPNAYNLNEWTHVTAVYSGTDLKVFLNGILKLTLSGTLSAAPNTGKFAIGSESDPTNLWGNYFIGYIADLRIISGTMLYATNFSPPSTPLTAIPNTVLLTLQNNSVANNRAFRDASDSNAILTPIGTTVSQGTANPYGRGWSGYFDGTGDYLLLPSTSGIFNFDTNNFTIEAWIYPTALAGFQQIAGATYSASGAALYLTGTALTLYSTGAHSNLNKTPDGSILQNTWQHVAAVRSSGILKLYINGIERSSVDFTANLTTNDAEIGRRTGINSEFYFGYINNLRVVKGTAVYTANFTPPVSDLPRILNTALLTLQSNRFVDNSENNFTITRFGNASIERFSPYRTPGYNSLVNSGSMYFNGSTDYLEMPHNANQLIGTGDFTIEAWVYLTSYGVGNPILAKGSATAGAQRFLFNTRVTSGILCFEIDDIRVVEGGVVPLNSWNHVAVTRSAGTMYLWLNGVLTATAANATNFTLTTEMRVGRANGNTNVYFNGHISNLRFVVGTALYIGPVDEPLTAIDNTVLLTAQSSSLIDNSTYGNTITGSATTSTSVPFGINPGGNGYFSYSFTGTNQVLSVANTSTLNFGSNDFTIEAWIYPTSVSGEKVIASLYGYSNGRRSWYLGIDGGNIRFRTSNAGGSASNLDSLRTLLPNAWYFISATKQGTTRRIYINGQLDVSDSASATLYNNTVDPIYIGAVGPNLTGYFAGLISNLRILNGAARIPAAISNSFTVPQTPAKAEPNTVLLLNGTNSAIVDRTGQNDLATVGNAKLQKPFYYDNQSVLFPGSGSYLNIPYNAAHNLSNGNFTIEAWVFPTTTGAFRGLINNWQIGGQFQYYLSDTNTLGFNWTNASSGISSGSYVGTTPITANAWTHIATVRNGTSLTHYINGVIDAGGSFNIGTQTLFYYNGEAKDLRIGVSGDLGNPFTGTISDLRMVKGTAVYTANFTRPTTRLTAIANTLLLTCRGTEFRDYSSNNFAVNPVGTPTLTPGTQFGQSSFTQTSPFVSSIVPNSIYFSTKTDYLAIRATPNLITFPGDFTFEAWIYPSDTTITYWKIWDSRQSGAAAQGMVIGVVPLASPVAGQGRLEYYNGSANLGTGIVYYNRWTHIAFVRSGITMTFYIDGVAGGTAAVSGTQTGTATTNPIYVGTKDNGLASYGTVGYIDNFRITNGVARYTSNFSVPQAPFPTR